MYRGMRRALPSVAFITQLDRFPCQAFMQERPNKATMSSAKSDDDPLVWAAGYVQQQYILKSGSNRNTRFLSGSNSFVEHESPKTT